MEELYKNMYYHLFNKVTDALSSLKRLEVEAAINCLMDAQQETEKMYMDGQQE